jgi:hypothetical protein
VGGGHGLAAGDVGEDDRIGEQLAGPSLRNLDDHHAVQRRLKGCLLYDLVLANDLHRPRRVVDPQFDEPSSARTVGQKSCYLDFLPRNQVPCCGNRRAVFGVESLSDD